MWCRTKGHPHNLLRSSYHSTRWHSPHISRSQPSSGDKKSYMFASGWIRCRLISPNQFTSCSYFVCERNEKQEVNGDSWARNIIYVHLFIWANHDCFAFVHLTHITIHNWRCTYLCANSSVWCDMEYTFRGGISCIICLAAEPLADIMIVLLKTKCTAMESQHSYARQSREHFHTELKWKILLLTS